MQPNRQKELFYDGMAETFDTVRNRYEVEKRMRLVFDEFLGRDNLHGKWLLDAGCGTGEFTQLARARGAIAVALDIGMALVQKTRRRCDEALGLVGDLGCLPLQEGWFDYVVCTEAIEHTRSPRDSVRELCRTIKPGGKLVLTVPNRLWHFALRIAKALNTRPYDGYEYWLWQAQLQRWLLEERMEILEVVGFNIIPITVPALNGLIAFCDRFGRPLRGMMVNLGVVARKRLSERIQGSPWLQ